jgi:serine/threonine protein kinase
MPDSPDNAVLLVNLAAEGIADVIKGCAHAVAAARNSAPNLADGLPPKAINFFGPRIVERWLKGFDEAQKTELLNTIAQLASLPVAESRRQAVAAIDRVANGASAEDKSTAVEYLTVIPLSVRRALVHNPDTGRMALPTQFMHDDGTALIRILPADVPPFPIGTDLPGTTYVLEELLGVGGFGAVYKAKNRCEQHQPPRAIKFCLEPSMAATLHRERAILDRLMAVDVTKWSPRIVRLYGYALEAKPPFLVYEYVPGGDLTSNVRVAREKTGRGFRPALALELIRQVTEALAFAHNQGLVHRDLKPANVLVSGSKIKLTDFGIGGVVANQVARSNSVGGSLAGISVDQATFFRGSGTPLYMSPEQRRGDQPDPRHDLFSLGVMWYQLIIGDVSRELHPGWPDELIEEYQTPKEHIEVIQKCVGYFKKRPVHAAELLSIMPPPMNKSEAVSVSSVISASPSADPTLEFDRLKALLADQLERDAMNEARDTIAAILRMNPGDQEAVEAQIFVNERLSGAKNAESELAVFREHQAWVRGVGVSSDGRFAISAGDDRQALVWDLSTFRPVRALTGHGAAIMSAVFSPDGRRALTGSWDATARLWDLASAKEVRRFVGGWTAVKSVGFSPDGTYLVLSADDKQLHVFETETGRLMISMPGHTDTIQSVVFSPEGRRLVSGGDDSTVRIWDLDAGKEATCFRGHGDSVTCVAFAPNGRWALSGSSDNTARMWDVQTGKELRNFKGHSNWVNAVAFSPRALQILTGSGGEIVNNKFAHGSDMSVRLWDLQTEKELFRYGGHEASVTCVAFASDGKRAVSGGLDNTVRYLQLP